MNIRFLSLILLVSLLIDTSVFSQQTESYKLPPQSIIELVDAPSTPSISIGVKAAAILVMESSELPALDDLAAEELRLGGLRIDPMTNGPSRTSYYKNLKLMRLDGSNERQISNLPKNARIRNIQWSPDEKFIAFTHTSENDIQLWIIDIETASAKRLNDAALNEVLRPAYQWHTDSKSLLYKGVDKNRKEAPKAPRTADGPIVQENFGRKAALRTFQDLLKNPYDEQVFIYYASSILEKVDIYGKTQTILPKASLIGSFDVSPDGKFILYTQYLEPFSYEVPYSRFAHSYLICDSEGVAVKILAEIPLSDNLPQGFDAVRMGMRSPQWRADSPATIFWVEATDNGDPAAKAAIREQIYFLKAPFKSEAIASAALPLRFAGISWGNDEFALVNERWNKERKSRTYAFNPNEEDAKLELIFDRSSEDRYSDPGRFQFVRNEEGKHVLQFNKQANQLFLFGQGASPNGNFPFVSSFNIKTKEIKKLWESKAPYYEQAIRLIDTEKPELITRRESVDEQPNYFIRSLKRGKPKQISFFPDPMPAIRKLGKELIQYERADGVPLSGTLYLPEGFKAGRDEPLPTLIWAYPTEYKSSAAAGQMSGSPYSFTRLGASSPILMATQGYAVLNNAAFPVVGEGLDEPNDYFIEQLLANAEAAINKLVEMGVSNPDKIAVSGHSYGAFMTANLLSHSNLFAAGIARSGAYNRSLTPFGFQAEERTYWQAPEVYNQMSPFMHADKMKTPLLLLHGADDNNSGTFTMQTERYYDALRGLGATVKMVILPHEGHGYNARESVLHMHYETIEWLDKYVKNRKETD